MIRWDSSVKSLGNHDRSAFSLLDGQDTCAGPAYGSHGFDFGDHIVSVVSYLAKLIVALPRVQWCSQGAGYHPWHARAEGSGIRSSCWTCCRPSGRCSSICWPAWLRPTGNVRPAVLAGRCRTSHCTCSAATWAIVSRHRDGYSPRQPRPGETLVPFLNRWNDEWLTATRRLSPPLLIELLRLAGDLTYGYWAASICLPSGPGKLGRARAGATLARHRPRVHRALGPPAADPRGGGRAAAPGSRWIGPVVATFVHALPVTYVNVEAPAHTAVSLIVEGEGGGWWTVVRSGGGTWTLFAGLHETPSATVQMAPDRSGACLPSRSVPTVRCRGRRSQAIWNRPADALDGRDHCLTKERPSPPSPLSRTRARGCSGCGG